MNSSKIQDNSGDWKKMHETILKQSSAVEIDMIDKCIAFLDEVIRVEISNQCVRQSIALKAQLDAMKSSIKIANQDLPKIDTSGWAFKMRLFERITNGMNDLLDANKNDESRAFYIDYFTTELKSVASDHQMDVTMIGGLEISYILSAPFKKLYFKVLDFAELYYTYCITKITNPDTSKEPEFDCEVLSEPEKKPILQTSAKTPGISHFNQAPTKIDFNKNINECDEDEIVIRFRVAYSLQCDKEFFVWPFSKMYKKVKNHDSISLNEIKSHAEIDSKSRTAQVVRGMGLKI